MKYQVGVEAAEVVAEQGNEELVLPIEVADRTKSCSIGS